MSANNPQAATASARLKFGWWWLLGVAGLLLIGGAWLTRIGPRRETDDVIARFARLVNAGDRTALALLGSEAVFDDEPVSEAEADARQTDYYLRRPELRVLDVRPGELGVPRTKGARLTRFTLATEVQGSTPSLRIRNDKGVIESPSRLFIINPDLVVEVREGKIHGVRAELRRD